MVKGATVPPTDAQDHEGYFADDLWEEVPDTCHSRHSGSSSFHSPAMYVMFQHAAALDAIPATAFSLSDWKVRSKAEYVNTSCAQESGSNVVAFCCEMNLEKSVLLGSLG